LLVEAGHRGVVQHPLRALGAAATAGRDLKPALEAIHGMRSVLAGRADLSIRDLVADTNVHGRLTDVWLATGAEDNRKKNDSQYYSADFDQILQKQSLVNIGSGAVPLGAVRPFGRSSKALDYL
jgi:hypothetical protein